MENQENQEKEEKEEKKRVIEERKEERSREICLLNEGIDDFSSVGSLEGVLVLNLHSNRLSSLKGLISSSSSSSSFQSCSLLELNLSSNLFHGVPDLSNLSLLTNLKILDLSGNSIKSLENIPYLFSMENFSIAFNQLETLNGLDCFPSLQRLDVRGNQLSSVVGFSVIENLIDLKEIELSSVVGRNKNPICEFVGEIVKIFDFHDGVKIDKKNKLEWMNILNPPLPLPPLPLLSSSSETPKVDALLEKYRQNRFSNLNNNNNNNNNVNHNNVNDNNFNNNNNPWNHTIGVKSTLSNLRRGDIIKKQMNNNHNKTNNEQLKNEENITKFLLNKDSETLDGETLTNSSSMISVGENEENQNNNNTNNNNNPNLSHKNILQLSISLLKVLYRVESQKQIQHYFYEWKEKTLLMNVCSLKMDLLQENDLLRSTIQLSSQKSDEQKSKLKELTQENEKLKMKNLKIESEYHGKIIQQENICNSQKKEYLKLKELYKEFEIKKEEERELSETRLRNEMKELRLKFEMEKNELNLQIELKNCEINEQKYKNEELREENRQISLKHLDESKDLNENTSNRINSYEKLLEMKEKERKLVESRLGEIINEEKMKYDMLERILNELKNERNELKSELNLSENEKKKKNKKVDELERENESLRGEIRNIIEKNKGNENKISELRNILLKLKNRCEELMLIKNQNEVKLEERENELNLMKREIESNKMLNENRELKIELYKLSESYKEVLNEKTNKEKDNYLTIQTQQHQLSSLNITIQTLKDKNKTESLRSNETIYNLENEIKELQMKNEEMEGNMNIELKEIKLNYKNKLREFEESSQREIDKYVKEINHLKQELKQRENDIE